MLPLARTARTHFSNRRLVEDLGWRPRFNLAQARDDFLDWMDKHES